MKKFFWWLRYWIILLLAIYFIGIKGGILISHFVFSNFTLNYVPIIIGVILLFLTFLAAHLLYLANTVEERMLLKEYKLAIKILTKSLK